MAVGFRKSFMGFNCDDVMAYIEKSHKSFKDKHSKLSEEIEALSVDLHLTKDGYQKLVQEKTKVEAQLLAFTEKYDEIQRLSDNIGKLYLVAQANAQSIMASTDNSIVLSHQEIDNNLKTIDAAHASLGEMKNSLLATSNDFAAQVDNLIADLIEAKTKIVNNTAAADAKKSDFDSLFQSLTK